MAIAVALGKLHVYPQRNRIGFDEVLLCEEGRHHLGVEDPVARNLNTFRPRRFADKTMFMAQESS
jgi:hypothetical protein